MNSLSRTRIISPACFYPIFSVPKTRFNRLPMQLSQSVQVLATRNFSDIPQRKPVLTLRKPPSFVATVHKLDIRMDRQQPYVRQSWELAAAGMVALATLYLVTSYFEESSDPKAEATLPLPSDADKLWKDTHEFVQQFNADPGNDKLYRQAYQRLCDLKYLSGLGQCYNGKSDFRLARKCLTELLHCKNLRIQSLALHHLHTILSTQIDPKDAANDLIQLEKYLGQALLSMTGESALLIEEGIRAYGLVIEQLVGFHLQAGTNIASQHIFDMLDRIAKLTGNVNSPNFQFHIYYTKALVTHLKKEHPRKITDSVFAISRFSKEAGGKLQEQAEFLSHYGKLCFDMISALVTRRSFQEASKLVTELNSPKGSAELVKFVQNAPEIKEALLKLSRELGVSFASSSPEAQQFEQVLMLKTLWGCLPQSTHSIKALTKIASDSEYDWYICVAAVQELNRIVLSNHNPILKKQAFKALVSLIKPQTHWQVRYSIKETLFLLRPDADFYCKLIEAYEKDEQCPYPENSLRDISKAISLMEKIHCEKHQLKQDIQSYLRKEEPERLPEEQYFPRIQRLPEQQYSVTRLADVEKVAECFRKAGSKDSGLKSVFQVLHGLGGTGKSWIAVDYAYRHVEDYAGICSLRADQLEDDLELLAKELEKELKIQGETLEARRIDLKEKLEKIPPNKPGWLLIVDNANFSNDNEVQETIHKFKRWLPSNRNHILITSRNPGWENLTGSIYPLQQFTPQQATTYILQFFKPRGSGCELLKPYDAPEKVASQKRAIARQLASDLGNLPLALGQARAYFYKKTAAALTLEEYGVRFRDTKRKLEYIGSSAPEVLTTWNMNMDCILADNPLAAATFMLCCHFDSYRIPRKLLKEWLESSSQKSSISNPVLALDNALTKIGEYSMISSEPGFVSIHPLLQEVACDYFSKKQDPGLPLASNIINEAFSILEKAFASDFKNQEGISLLNTLSLYYPHGLSLLKHTEKDHGLKERRTKLYTRIVDFISTFGDWEYAIEVTKTAKNIHYENLDWRAVSNYLTLLRKATDINTKKDLNAFMAEDLSALFIMEREDLDKALEALKTGEKDALLKAVLLSAALLNKACSTKNMDDLIQAECLARAAIVEYEKQNQEGLEYDYLQACHYLSLLLVVKTNSFAQDVSHLVEAREWYAKAKKLSEKFDGNVKQSIQKMLQSLAEKLGIEE